MSSPNASPILKPIASLSVKKRKRDDDTKTHTPAEIDARPFAIRPSGDNVHGKTTYLIPLCLLQRAHLPLAALDVQGSGSRLFAAHIQVLESLHEHGVEGQILVAEQKEEDRLYVVERTARRVYALCRLGRWITREALIRLSQCKSIGATRNVKRKITAPTDSSPWWSLAAVDLPKERLQGHGHILPLLNVKMSTPEIKAVPQLLPTEARLRTAKQDDAVLAQRVPMVQESAHAIVDSDSQDPVEELARQYLDALYLSRTSLAYFAKGPLPRARSTITGAAGSQATSSDLVDFLRNSVLPVTVMDKKYKDNLPTCIKDLPLVTPSQDEKPVKTRRRKKFKPKRDKAGLFTNEQEYIGKWWRGEETSGSMTSPESIDTALRRRIPGLRSRETYLQVIIILETLHLEATDKATLPTIEEPRLITGYQQETESQMALGATKRKGKKALDLRLLLETLLDRLCIWQDLDAHAPAKDLVSEKDAKHNEPSNDLRDFCIEIIVPFFMSRLPKEAALINKKLGGPSPPTPEKRKLTSSRSRPGEPATRSRPEKQPRKPLSRVATEILNQATRPVPSLHRSATDSVIIKREDSQPTMSSIPPARPPMRVARESSLSLMLSGHRQVDLAAKSAAASERLRKKKETEAQVREAINNARKPNRPMATKEVAARADETFEQALPKSSRSARPHAAPPSVHVAATPKRAKSAHSTAFISASAQSSKPSVVPASSVRPSLGPRIDSMPAVPQTSHRETANARRASGIEETPSRNSSSKFTFLSPTAGRSAPISFHGDPCESPSARHHVAATPLKMVGRKVNFGLRDTPAVASATKRTASATLVEATPVKGAYGISEPKQERDIGSLQNGQSIYDAWNDDYEELA